jgi:hypothetical protein
MPFIDLFTRRGIGKGLIISIEAVLEVKFGEDGLKLMPEIRQIQDHEILHAVLQKIKTAPTPDHVRRLWAGTRRAKRTRRS